MSEVLWQANPAWSKVKLGNGASTIGRGGCLLTCLTEAARTLTSRPNLIPPHVNETCRQVGAFQASLLALDKAAIAMGLECSLKDRVDGEPGEQKLKDALLAALDHGMAVIHVDKDGLDGGDHFILATGKSPEGNIICKDPAVASVVVLQWPALTALVRWGKTLKSYRVVSVRPLHLLPS